MREMPVIYRSPSYNFDCMFNKRKQQWHSCLESAGQKMCLRLMLEWDTTYGTTCHRQTHEPEITTLTAHRSPVVVQDCAIGIGIRSARSLSSAMFCLRWWVWFFRISSGLLRVFAGFLPGGIQLGDWFRYWYWVVSDVNAHEQNLWLGQDSIDHACFVNSPQETSFGKRAKLAQKAYYSKLTSLRLAHRFFKI